MFALLKAFFFEPGPTYPWKKVLFLVILSTLIVGSISGGGYILYRYTERMQSAFDAGTIQALVVTTPQLPEKTIFLPTAYAAEKLGLSSDQTVPLASFDLEKAKQNLLASGELKEAHLKKIKPNILFIEYSVRVPLAMVHDFFNTAIDENGVLFPYAPLFPPRRLPKIYLGAHAPALPWGKSLEKEWVEQINTLFHTLAQEKIEWIDISRADAPSAGQREIIIRLAPQIWLRVTPKNAIEQLANYFILKQNYLKKDQMSIIDLRLSDVAYICKD